MCLNMFAKPILVVLLGGFVANPVSGQLLKSDTLILNLETTESIFLKQNNDLLAMHFQVRSDSALIQQARFWSNPVLNTDQNVFSNNQFFEHSNTGGSPTGQYYIQLQQLLYTAGKRKKQIDLANTNVALSHWAYEDLLRTLKLELRTDFYTLAGQLEVLNLQKELVKELNKLVLGMSEAFNAGNVSKKDYLRIEALEFTLSKEIIENENQVNDLEASLKNLLQLETRNFYKACKFRNQTL